MPPRLDDLLYVPSRQELFDLFMNVLRGLYPVRKEGFGSGKLALAGTPILECEARVEVTTTGTLSTARIRYSLDAGASWAQSNVLIPTSGLVALGATGVVLQFSPGKAGTGTSFMAGDAFTFELHLHPFPVTSWQPGSVARTLIEIGAVAFAEFAQLGRKIAAGGFAKYAAAEWLDLIAVEVYGLTNGRRKGTLSKHTVRLSDPNGAGPITILPNRVWMLSNSGLRFVNETGGTLVKNGTLDITVVAEQVGSEYNVPLGSIQRLVTTMPGITVSNIDNGTGTSIVQQGTAQETNAELFKRCQQRWPSLAQIPTDGLYELWAKTASDEVTRVFVSPHLTIPGQVDIYLAGPSGGVSVGAVSAVNTFIQKRISLTNTAVIQNATSQAVNVTATLKCDPAYLSTVVGEAEGLLLDYVQATAISGKLYDAGVIEVLMQAQGMVDVDLTWAGDIQLARGQVAIPGTFTLTPVSV